MSAHPNACIGAALFAFTLLGAAAAHCGSATQDAGEAAYGAQNTACVALATSRTQAEACVSATQAIWCGPGGLWTSGDAGLCGAGGKDAGHE